MPSAPAFRQAMTVSGSPDVALVMRGGADSEMMSVLGREDTRIVMEAPGVARTDEGAVASAELFVVINLPLRSTGTDANVALRGDNDLGDARLCFRALFGLAVLRERGARHGCKSKG